MRTFGGLTVGFALGCLFINPIYALILMVLGCVLALEGEK